MPADRLAWVPRQTLDLVNQWLRTFFATADANDRWQFVTVTRDSVLPLFYVKTVILTDSSAGDVALMLPLARSVPGFAACCKVVDASHAVTLAAASGETIDGSASALTVTDPVTVASDGRQWYQVT